MLHVTNTSHFELYEIAEVEILSPVMAFDHVLSISLSLRCGGKISINVQTFSMIRMV